MAGDQEFAKKYGANQQDPAKESKSRRFCQGTEKLVQYIHTGQRMQAGGQCQLKANSLMCLHLRGM